MPKRKKTGRTEATLAVKAIIPAAGLGKRFLPLSAAVPKELLPVNRKPLIQWALEEAMASGFRSIGIVIRKGKEVIKDYIDGILKLPDVLHGVLRKHLGAAEIHFILQREPLGLGNAIYEARDFIGNSPFVMIIPDQFLLSKVPAAKQLLDGASEDPHSVWNSVVRISDRELPLFPGARGFKLSKKSKDRWDVLGIEESSFRYGEPAMLGFGRTYFPEGVVQFFSNEYMNPETGEVDLLPTFEGMIQKVPLYAILLQGRPMDFGTWSGYEFFTRTLNSSRLPPGVQPGTFFP